MWSNSDYLNCKDQSLSFVNWGLMLYTLSMFWMTLCVIAMRLVHSVCCSEPILQVMWTVQLQWLLVVQTVVRFLHIELQLCPLWVSDRKKTVMYVASLQQPQYWSSPIVWGSLYVTTSDRHQPIRWALFTPAPYRWTLQSRPAALF